ncbi:MAG: ABC transporter ATP-binding protein [Anaerolineales bacterium]
MNALNSLSKLSAPLLSLHGVTKRFNGVVAVDKVDLEIHTGELLSLIGPNGSGKTTLFNCITGYLRPEEGRILLGEDEITHERPDRIALRGISRTFQNVRIFPGLTVLENLLVSLQQYQEENLLLRTLHAPRIRHLEAQAVERAMALLEMVQLADHAQEEAHNLVYGQRKMLEFACSLIPDPQLVLLDEPAAGVSTALVDEMKRYILQLNQQGKTFFVVEHNMGVVMDISQRIIVLDYGQKIAEGAPAEIRDNPQVREAYFGK